MLEQIQHGQGFIAALDQSGGSTPKALANYGISENSYANDQEMFDLVHQMRSRIITSPAFTSEHIIGAILFERTMSSKIGDKFTAEYLWQDKHVVPFLKIDNGLAERSNGVQLMKPIPELEHRLNEANRHNVFGTKMRSVIYEANEQGIADAGEVKLFEKPLITNSATQNMDRTGYRQRKHYTYDYSQSVGDELLGVNACPIFRVAEAYVNYIEACYERTGQINSKADQYWRALRRRAGVDEDYNKTIAATDINRELELQDLSAWSGNGPVDATLFNIRRERRCEFIGEGMRWDDLKRWRSWDRLFTHPYIPEGFNLWDQAYQNYTAETAGQGNGELVADGSTNANASPESVSKYLRPYQRTQTNNDLYNGYTWMKAYYLSPIGIQELTLAPQMYQNPYWDSEDAGLALE